MSYWPDRGTLCAVVAALALCAIQPVAAGEERLTTDGRFKTDPVFVGRAGQEVVYTVQERPTLLRLLRLDLATRIAAPVHREQEARSEFEPAFSSDGRRMAFVQNRGNLSLTLVISDADGRESAVPIPGGFAGPHSPVFLPDESRVLFSNGQEGRQPIVSVNLTGNDRKVLIDSAGVNNWPSLSPDGSRLAFGSSRDGDFEIYTADRDGSHPKRLTNSPRMDLRPRFSPDGQRIAFTSNRDGNYEIYVMSAKGSNVTRITNHPERDDYPAWHPDGRRLVIVGERGGRHDLYLVEVP